MPVPARSGVQVFPFDTQLRPRPREHPTIYSLIFSRNFVCRLRMKLTRANDGKHKWIAEFKDGTHTRFGAVGMDDYTLTHDADQRERYRTRHKKDLATHDPKKAGFLSYYLLWGESTSLLANQRAYERRFNL